MTPEAIDFLRRRAEAHSAACADLENDPLIEAVFGKPRPRPPAQSPMQPGSMLRRQAD